MCPWNILWHGHHIRGHFVAGRHSQGHALRTTNDPFKRSIKVNLIIVYLLLFYSHFIYYKTFHPLFPQSNKFYPFLTNVILNLWHHFKFLSLQFSKFTTKFIEYSWVRAHWIAYYICWEIENRICCILIVLRIWLTIFERNYKPK